MAAVAYGHVAIVPKGVWNADTQYEVCQLVEYDGSSYVAKAQPPVGTLPTDTSYWQVSAAGTKKASSGSLGTVMPDGSTTEVNEAGKLSAKTAQQDAVGVVKGSDDITVGEDGNLTVNTEFEQATELANLIAGEAIKSVLGKVSKAIAATMNLDQNALLKNMISGIDVNSGEKVPSSAFVHTLYERLGMGTDLSAGDAENVTQAVNALYSNLMKNNAGAHNAIYRGKSLGSTVTTAQYNAIKAGTFEDLYIGDYWTIGGVNYRIAAFDYYLNSGDTVCTTHHAVIVPDTCLYNAQMHNTSSGQYESGAANTTAGGYVGSDMYTKNLETAKTTIKNAFSGHVLKHRIYLTNAVANGRASAGAWCDSEVDLMCEQMVYGSGIFSPVSDGSNVPVNYRVEKSQLPLFQNELSRICNRNNWWLRDVITASSFARVSDDGYADYGNASYSRGVRPAFCIS